jgi:hypothetical protein
MLAILSVWKKVVVVLRCRQRWFYFPTSDKGCGSVASCACFCLGVRRRWFGFLLRATVVVLFSCACSVLVVAGGGSVSGNGGGYGYFPRVLFWCLPEVVLFPATVVDMFCACSVLVFAGGGSVFGNGGGSGADALWFCFPVSFFGFQIWCSLVEVVLFLVLSDGS